MYKENMQKTMFEVYLNRLKTKPVIYTIFDFPFDELLVGKWDIE